MVADVTFIGNATTLLRIGAFTLLTDPNFLHAGQHAYLGYGMWSRRKINPAMEIEQLPPLDGVVLSHLHGDHFDSVARRGLPASLPIVTTRHAERRLRSWKFTEVEGLLPWSSTEWRRDDEVLTVTSVPAQHGPIGVHHLLPPAMGSVVDHVVAGERRMRMYITGDTLFRPRLREIADRFPDIDTMLIHLGGTRIAGLLLTMDAKQGAALTELIGAAVTVPIHYDDYPVMRSPVEDYERAVAERGIAGRVQRIGRGETLALPGPGGSR